MGKIFVITFLIISSGLIAFPVSMEKDWYGRDGRHLEFQQNKGSWQQFKSAAIDVSSIKGEQDKNGIRTITLYKSISINPEELKNLREDVSILFTELANVSEIYLNGEKIGGKGRIENGKIVSNGVIRNYNVAIPTGLIRENNELYVILSGEHRDRITMMSDTNFLIDKWRLNAERVSERITLMLLFLYLFVGFYHLLLFIKRPIERYNLYFGLFCVIMPFYFFTRSNTVFEVDVDQYIISKVEFIALYFLPPLFMLFFDSFFYNKIHRFPKFYLYFIYGISVTTALSPHWLTLKWLLIWQLSVFSMLIYTLRSMFKAIKHLKSKDAFRLLIGFIVVVITAVLDLLGAIPVGDMKNYGLMRFGFFSFIVGIAVVLANRFLKVHKEVEELNHHLERKVEQRTAELQKTLNDVKELKVQQDGDYFLTSLLIKPLGVNQAVSNNVNVKFFVRQKKRFEFRKWTTEIGGDLCIAHSIRLKGKNYTVILNGDAMGKSIQGAGGALVLGTVFKSVIARTQFYPAIQDQYPERWLKNCFIELQNIFESFDGSMLISVVLGMVEDETGLLYYINAEHPWSVLYRDGKAEFIENKLLFHKIGVMGLDGSLRIQTYQLHPNDVIIIGSDGRDDILIGIDDSGNRIINEDESQFLRRVEEGGGNLEKIADSIQKMGELTDDFTLLRIAYRENEGGDGNEKTISEKYRELLEKGKNYARQGDTKNAVQELEKAYLIDNSDPELISELAKQHIKIKEYSRAAMLCEDYSFLKPADNEFIYMASSAFKLAKDLKKAADFGERLKLRDPDNVKNLINLADIYRQLDNTERARKILSQALQLDPENAHGQKLSTILDSMDQDQVVSI